MREAPTLTLTSTPTPNQAMKEAADWAGAAVLPSGAAAVSVRSES